MSDDENQIRALHATWIAASQTGDTATVLSLMTDDVVFLVPGREPMHKAEFAAASQGQNAPGGIKIEGTSEIQEVKIAGEWAFMWTRLKVVVTPPSGAPRTRAGHTLTVLRKDAGQWRVTRDANLLAPVASA